MHSMLGLPPGQNWDGGCKMIQAAGNGHCIQSPGGMSAHKSPARAHMLYRQAEEADREGNAALAERLRRLAKTWDVRS